MNPAKKTIAIIDDDFLIRRSLERLLTACGYGTDAFATGEEFLTNVATCEADCLVLDIDLTDTCGLELARHPSVRALQCSIVFMSGTCDEDIRRQARELSGADCVRKPFKAVELLTAIAVAVRKR